MGGGEDVVVRGEGGGRVEGQSEGEGGLNSPHRLFALVDGVFAIAMTLLALDVRVPDGVQFSHHAATDFYGHFGVFLAAFLITGRFWLVNHRMLAEVRTVDAEALQRTLTFLAGISSIPVGTAVLFRFGSVPQAVAFASVLLAATTLLSGRLWWYVSDPAHHLSSVDPQTRLPRLLRLIWNAVIYLLAAPVAYLLSAIASDRHSHVAWAMLTWLLLGADSVFTRTVMRVRERRAR